MQFQMAQKSGKSGVGRHLVDTPGMPSEKSPEPQRFRALFADIW